MDLAVLTATSTAMMTTIGIQRLETTSMKVSLFHSHLRRLLLLLGARRRTAPAHRPAQRTPVWAVMTGVARARAPEPVTVLMVPM